jgi:predicted exporter
MINKLGVFLSIAAFIALAVCFFARPFHIQTDITALLPSTGDGDTRQTAFNHISGNSMGSVNILFGAPDVESSKEAGLYFASLLEGTKLNYLIDSDYTSFLSDLESYHYRLLSEQNRQKIGGGNSFEIAESAIAMLYSPAGAAVLGFEQDPFMLTGDYLFSSALLKSGFSPSRDVLVSTYEGKVYSYMILEIAPDELFSPGRLDVRMQAVSAAKDATIARFPGVEINISGIPVHTWHASSSSTREMTVISIISILLVLVISLAALRSFLSFVVAMTSIAIAFAVGFMTTATILGGVHVLTLVFGTSLVGLSIDYMLHYLVERGSGMDALSSIRSIRTALTLSLATSLMGFCAMLASNMLLLRQMALFSMAGLICAWLLVLFFYPMIFKRLKPGTPPAYVIKSEKALSSFSTRLISGRVAVKVLIFVVICVFGISRVHISDDISALYKPSADLIEAEKLFSLVNKENISLMFFFVAGSDSAQVLADEEKLTQALEKEVEAGNLEGFKAISQLVPSPARQAENLALSAKLWDEQAGYLQAMTGLSAEQIAAMRAALFSQTENLRVEDVLEIEQLSALKNFWVEGKGSIVLLKGVKNPTKLALLEEENIFFLDKLGDLNKAMTSYRHKLMLTIGAAWMLIMAVMMWRFGLHKGFLASLVPLAAIVTTLALLGFAGVTLSGFHILALFLVLCFGVDYTVFQMETKGRLKYSGLAVMLSCLTTLASFGFLAFTGFEVTKALGLTLFIGILAAYLCSLVAKNFADS